MGRLAFFLLVGLWPWGCMGQWTQYPLLNYATSSISTQVVWELVQAVDERLGAEEGITNRVEWYTVLQSGDDSYEYVTNEITLFVPSDFVWGSNGIDACLHKLLTGTGGNGHNWVDTSEKDVFSGSWSDYFNHPVGTNWYFHSFSNSGDPGQWRKSRFLLYPTNFPTWSAASLFTAADIGIVMTNEYITTNDLELLNDAWRYGETNSQYVAVGIDREYPRYAMWTATPKEEFREVCVGRWSYVITNHWTNTVASNLVHNYQAGWATHTNSYGLFNNHLPHPEALDEENPVEYRIYTPASNPPVNIAFSGLCSVVYTEAVDAVYLQLGVRTNLQITGSTSTQYAEAAFVRMNWTNYAGDATTYTNVHEITDLGSEVSFWWTKPTGWYYPYGGTMFFPTWWKSSNLRVTRHALEERYKAINEFTYSVRQGIVSSRQVVASVSNAIFASHVATPFTNNPFTYVAGTGTLVYDYGGFSPNLYVEEDLSGRNGSRIDKSVCHGNWISTNTTTSTWNTAYPEGDYNHSIWSPTVDAFISVQGLPRAAAQWTAYYNLSHLPVSLSLSLEDPWEYRLTFDSGDTTWSPVSSPSNFCDFSMSGATSTTVRTFPDRLTLGGMRTNMTAADSGFINADSSNTTLKTVTIAGAFPLSGSSSLGTLRSDSYVGSATRAVPPSHSCNLCLYTGATEVVTETWSYDEKTWGVPPQHGRGALNEVLYDWTQLGGFEFK